MDNDNLNHKNERKHKADSGRPTVSFHGSAGVPLGNIGQYKLISILGEGGFSIVYLAEQAKPVKRLVALKVIKPGMDTKQVIARFEAERQTLAFLNHPNIAPVYDAGATEQGLPYFVMEHVKGIPITEHCDRHKLSIEDRLELFLHVCDGVQYAHQKGIIHRDIKPSNILVSVDSEKAAPRIIDFGVSKATTKQINERTLFTEQGQFVGTPEYMSPEQAEMGAQDIDTRTDIYSLGVVLYELLTGVLPFDPDVLRESSIDNIRKIIREQDPKRPSTILATLGEEAKRIAENRNIDLSNLKKRLNRELEWIPLKAMRKDRTRRYRSASQFADDIRNYLNRKPLIAGPESAIYKMKKFVNRNKPLFSGAAAILIILIAGIIVSTNFGIKASHAQKEAEAERLKAQQEARSAKAVSDFLRKDLLESMAPYAVQKQDKDITVRSWLDDTSDKLEGRFENEPLIEAQIRYSLGKSYFNLGIYDLAEKHLIRAYALQLEKLGNKNIDTLNSMELLGSVYMKMGFYGEAENLFNQTISGRKEIFKKADDPNTLSTMNELAVSYLSSGQYDKAEKLYNEALPISEKVFGENGTFTLIMTGNLADVYRLQGHYKKAEDLYLKARKNMNELYYNGLNTPDDPDTLYFAIYSGNGLGMLYINEGNYADALNIFSDTYKLGTVILEKGHPDTLYSMNGLGFVYTAMRNYELAKQYIDEALNIGKELGENNPSTLTSRYCLGWLEYNIGLSKYDEQHYEEAKAHFAEAEVNLNKALDGREKVFRYYPDHPAILEAKNALAMLYSAMGNLSNEELNYEEAKTLFAKAQGYFNEALSGRQRVLGNDHPATLETQNGLALLYWAMGKYSDAKKLLEDALSSRITILGAEHPDTLATQEALSELEYIMQQEQTDTKTEETPVKPD